MKYKPMTERQKKAARAAMNEALATEGIVVVAQTMGVKNQAVYKWLKSGVMPVRRAVDFEFYFGAERERLRPDLWG